ncbi:MAG: hypothetical protein A3E88_04075 [Legionellales bacterium RIFCSPHIGHO2_12_FULL_35_11]|nr:MAG: hypothetical protein A3E88_04075 [Legionellales bacterium RIFCSPHIGHO2_12_FULL_35_11]
MRVRYALFILICVNFLVCCGKPTHKYQGYISATNIYLSSEFAGKLDGLMVKKGDKVKKGDLLFKLSSKPQIFNLNETKAILNQAHSTLADLKKPKRIQALKSIEAKIAQNDAQISLASIRVKRNQTLFDKHVLAKDNLDLAREHLNELLAKKDQITADLELAKLGARSDIINAEESHVKSLETKVNSIRWEIAEKSVYAPDDGFIFDTYFTESEFVPSARPVLSLLTKINIFIEFFVPLREVEHLHVGNIVQYNYLADGNVYEAKISYISPEAEFMPPLIYSRENMDKLVFRLKALPMNNDKLMPGLPVTITILPNYVS